MSNASNSQKKINAWADIESMPSDLRECVHEYGYAIVKACLIAGVNKPGAIHQLVREIWEGARQPGQRGKLAGVPRVYNTLDWVLTQAGPDISAATLARVLANNSHTIAPLTPTREMIAASMNAINGMGLLTKRDKHQIRLRAALLVASEAAVRRTASEVAA